MKIYPIQKSDDEWQKILTEEAFVVTRKKQTEKPFSGAYNLIHAIGIYNCVCCNNPLLSSEKKYDSGTGWPSFTEVLNKSQIDLIPDKTLGMFRTEVLCAGCGGHLGHLFTDGPTPSSYRYCINSVSLNFVPHQ